VRSVETVNMLRVEDVLAHAILFTFRMKIA
jgi:hypothetical protein